jgi:hypothetical protein
MRVLANTTVFQGQARFIGPNAVQVNDQTLTAEQIFVNVGGRPLIPDMPGLEQISYLTNESMMVVDYCPSIYRNRRQLHRPRVRSDVPSVRTAKVTVIEMGSR